MEKLSRDRMFFTSVDSEYITGKHSSGGFLNHFFPLAELRSQI